MQNIFQKTLTKAVTFEGVGLHSGQISKIKVHPYKEDQGIIFKRTDIKRNNIIKANYTNVSSTKLCTTLENKHGTRVSTVEHLLAALYIAGIDNALIETNAEEIPIMDGSARDFLKVFNRVKTKSQLKKSMIWHIAAARGSGESEVTGKGVMSLAQQHLMKHFAGSSTH